MVKMFVACIMFAAGVPALAAQTYRLEPASIALGEPVTLTLTSRPGTLEKLDLTPVARDFEILGRTLGGDGREETLVLTLYPLHTGRIVFPNLGLPGRPPAVTVAEQSETTPKVHFRIETAPETYHVRQFVRLTVEACDDGSLLWQRPQLATREGLLVRPLNEEQVEAEHDGEHCTAHRWHWSALPTVAGVNVMPLPMLEAGKFGQRLRFPPPEARFDALPLPAWLPSDVAIGRPEISSAAVPAQWPVKRPLDWHFEVSGGYSADALNNLLRLQLANQPQFTAYAPNVQELPGESGEPRYLVSLYAQFRERGDTRLPELVLPWYDTATGRLQQLRLPGPAIQVFDPARQRLMAWLTGVAMAISVLALGHLLWRMLGWRWRRHRALAELRRVTDTAGLVRQLCAFSLSPTAVPAATLGEWERRMQNETEAGGLGALVDAVEGAHYGSAEAEFLLLLEAAGNCLAGARPIPRRRLRPRAPDPGFRA